MTHEPNTEHVLALAAIIREVNGGQHLWHVALAEAILAHPASQWGPAAPWPQLPREAPPEVLNLATFNACNQKDAAKLAWQCCRAEIDRQRIGQGLSVPEPAPWPQLPREAPPEALNRAMSICKVEAVKVVWQAACDQLENLKLSPQSVEDQDRQRAAAIAEAAWQWKRHKETRDREGKGAAPTPVPASWPELPRRPPASVWNADGGDVWHAARVELQRLREQAGIAPAAPTFPRISDSLMRSLIGDVLDESETATEAACMDRPYNPVPRIRARLTEILQLAAQDEAAERPAS